MTADIRITNVHENSVRGAWTVRGTIIGSGESFHRDTLSRDLVLICIGARVIGWPVQITTDERGDVVKVTAL